MLNKASISKMPQHPALLRASWCGRKPDAARGWWRLYRFPGCVQRHQRGVSKAAGSQMLAQHAHDASSAALAPMRAANLANLVAMHEGMNGLALDDGADGYRMRLWLPGPGKTNRTLPGVRHLSNELQDMRAVGAEERDGRLNRPARVIQRLGADVIRRVPVMPIEAAGIGEGRLEGHRPEVVAIGDMMDDLPDAPLFGLALQIKLLIGKSGKDSVNLFYAARKQIENLFRRAPSGHTKEDGIAIRVMRQQGRIAPRPPYLLHVGQPAPREFGFVRRQIAAGDMYCLSWLEDTARLAQMRSEIACRWPGQQQRVSIGINNDCQISRRVGRPGGKAQHGGVEGHAGGEVAHAQSQ